MTCSCGTPLRIPRPSVQYVAAQIDLVEDDLLNGDPVYFAYTAIGAAMPAAGNAAWKPAGWTTTRNRAEHLLDSTTLAAGDWQVRVRVPAAPQDLMLDAGIIRIV